METLPLDQITFEDASRHRRELTDIEGLSESIRRIGLLHPIVVDSSGKLLAGRRRLEAYRRLGYSTIPIRRYESLDQGEQRLVELDENLRRVDLTWQERAFAIGELATIQGGGVKEVADYIGLTEQLVGRAINVAKALTAGDPRILACTSLNQAAELLHRRKVLEFQTRLAEMGDQTHEQAESTDSTSSDSDGLRNSGNPRALSFPASNGDGTADFRVSPSEQSRPFAIIQADFFSFERSYRGPKFNFIHCDFPYGIGFDKSDAARVEGHESGYEDSAELFWELTRVLCHSENLIADSAHMIFWFSMKYYKELLDELTETGWFVHELPLVWYKSDGSGIASDYRRRPKHVYETAFWCSKGDRPLVKLANDVTSSPIARTAEGHVSAKPQAVLRHFMSMGVNDLSSVFDPTCGSGTSLRAAVDLGAARGLGLELNGEIAQASALKLTKALEEEFEL